MFHNDILLLWYMLAASEQVYFHLATLFVCFSLIFDLFVDLYSLIKLQRNFHHHALETCFLYIYFLMISVCGKVYFDTPHNSLYWCKPPTLIFISIETLHPESLIKLQTKILRSIMKFVSKPRIRSPQKIVRNRGCWIIFSV